MTNLIEIKKRLEARIDILKKDKSLLDDITKLETQLARYEGADRMVSTKELRDEINIRGIRPRMLYGVYELDNITKGFRYGEIIVMAAPPKAGKTTTALWLIEQLKDHKPAFLALEQPAYELVENSIIKGYDLPDFYAPYAVDVNRNVDWVMQRLLEAKLKAGSRVAFIDHFRWVQPKNQGKKNYTEIAEETIQELKVVAQLLDMTIYIIVHTGAKNKTPDEPPTVNDLFGSSSFHQYADQVFLIWRAKELRNPNSKKDGYKDSGFTRLEIAANRFSGDEGFIKLLFNDGKFTASEYDLIQTDNESPDYSR